MAQINHQKPGNMIINVPLLRRWPFQLTSAFYNDL